MWPPLEIPGIENVMTTLRSSVVPMPVVSGLTPRQHVADERRRHQPEHRSRGAAVEPVGLHQHRSGGPAEQRGDVHEREADPSDRRFEHLAEHVQQVHVEREMDDAEVQESRRHDAIPLAGVGGVEAAVAETSGDPVVR